MSHPNHPSRDTILNQKENKFYKCLLCMQCMVVAAIGSSCYYGLKNALEANKKLGGVDMMEVLVLARTAQLAFSFLHRHTTFQLLLVYDSTCITQTPFAAFPLEAGLEVCVASNRIFWYYSSANHLLLDNML